VNDRFLNRQFLQQSWAGTAPAQGVCAGHNKHGARRALEPEQEDVVMTLIRFSPSSALDLMSSNRDFDRFLDSFFTRSPGRADVASFAPPVDIEEAASEFVFRADLPGISLKDVKVSLVGDTLTIRGERKVEAELKDKGLRRTERSYGSFERAFTLNTPVQADRVQATYRDGVLEVRVPKAEAARAREIEVQVG
jgi:HSP20 family protein